MLFVIDHGLAPCWWCEDGSVDTDSNPAYTWPARYLHSPHVWLFYRTIFPSEGSNLPSIALHAERMKS